MLIVFVDIAQSIALYWPYSRAFCTNALHFVVVYINAYYILCPIFPFHNTYIIFNLLPNDTLHIPTEQVVYAGNSSSTFRSNNIDDVTHKHDDINAASCLPRISERYNQKYIDKRNLNDQSRGRLPSYCNLYGYELGLPNSVRDNRSWAYRTLATATWISPLSADTAGFPLRPRG